MSAAVRRGLTVERGGAAPGPIPAPPTSPTGWVVATDVLFALDPSATLETRRAVVKAASELGRIARDRPAPRSWADAGLRTVPAALAAYGAVCDPGWWRAPSPAMAERLDAVQAAPVWSARARRVAWAVLTAEAAVEDPETVWHPGDRATLGAASGCSLEDVSAALKELEAGQVLRLSTTAAGLARHLTLPMGATRATPRAPTHTPAVVPASRPDALATPAVGERYALASGAEARVAPGSWVTVSLDAEGSPVLVVNGYPLGRLAPFD